MVVFVFFNLLFYCHSKPCQRRVHTIYNEEVSYFFCTCMWLLHQNTQANPIGFYNWNVISVNILTKICKGNHSNSFVQCDYCGSSKKHIICYWFIDNNVGEKVIFIPNQNAMEMKFIYMYPSSELEIKATTDSETSISYLVFHI